MSRKMAKLSEAELNKRCQALPVVRTQCVERTKGGRDENNVITLPHPKYSREVDEWIDTFYSLEIADDDYIENCHKISDKPVSELTRDETLTRLTAVVRSERFCDGSIAEALENGVLEGLCVHLHEVTK